MPDGKEIHTKGTQLNATIGISLRIEEQLSDLA